MRKKRKKRKKEKKKKKRKEKETETETETEKEKEKEKEKEGEAEAEAEAEEREEKRIYPVYTPSSADTAWARRRSPLRSRTCPFYTRNFYRDRKSTVLGFRRNPSSRISRGKSGEIE